MTPTEWLLQKQADFILTATLSHRDANGLRASSLPATELLENCLPDPHEDTFDSSKQFDAPIVFLEADRQRRGMAFAHSPRVPFQCTLRAYLDTWKAFSTVRLVDGLLSDSAQPAPD